MSQRIRIRGAFPAGVKNIVLTGKGVTKVAIAGDLFLRVPYEDPHKLTVRVGTVDVYNGTVAAPEPHLDLNGVWQAQAVVPAQTTVNGNSLTTIGKVEWVRNPNT